MRVLITGANRGIGAALLGKYRAAGADAMGTARSGDLIPLDVSDPASIAALPEAVAGPLDLLVCNAGVYLEKGLSPADYTPQMWAETFAVNVTGVALTIQALLPQIRDAKGKIAIISSQMASDTTAPGGSYIYRSSKAAALNLGRNLATDLRGDGIAVGIYHPGWVRTDMGTDAADISVEEAASGLKSEFDRLSMDTTGCFRTWDGNDHPF